MDRAPSRRPRIGRTRSRTDIIDEQRVRGVRGGVISRHRAMASLSATPMLAVNALALPFALMIAVMFALPWVAERWGDLFRVLAGPLGLPGAVASRVVTVGDLYALAIPYIDVQAAWPSRTALIVGAVATALVFAVSFAFSPRMMPIRYALRALAAVQVVSLLYFAFAEPPFPYRLSDYQIGFNSTAAAVLALLPFLLGFTFFLFRIALWRKLLLSALVVVHLAVLFPLQVLAHVYLTFSATLLVLPVLFLVFGLLVETFVFVAFYGWGMSWVGSGVADAATPRRKRDEHTREEPR
jgi:hypothetical protein